MGFALAKTITTRFPGIAIHFYDVRSDRVALFEQELSGVQAAQGPWEVAEAAEVVFLAVKPQDIQPVLAAIRDTDRLVLSIAAGVPLARIESVLAKARVVRVMPNREVVKQLLGAAGYAAEVEEGLLDAVTGLSGSGPAFVALLIEAFVEAGRGLGLEPEVARDLSIQTFLGTAKLLSETGMQPRTLVDMVSSPNGTTLAGRQILDASDYAQVISKTIQVATERSKELGQ
jgi:pyrroline-5-carboxylate reductase